MKPIELEFESGDSAWRRTASGRMSGAPVVAAWLLVACGVGASMFAAWRVWESTVELAATEDALRAALAGARAVPAADAAWQRLSPSQRNAWNQVARQLNTPWSALLDALERATPNEVAIVSIEPDGAQGSVRLQAEAKTLDELLAYVSALKNTQPFESAALVKHETNEQDANHPVRLSIDLRLKLAKPAHVPQESRP